MTPSRIQERTVTEKAAIVRRMLRQLGELPMESRAAFVADLRTPAAAESFLRRALEALLDLGRHILAKGFGRPVVEYKQIALGLQEEGVLAAAEAQLMKDMAGYRNRMVHYYDEISLDELYAICRERRGEVEAVLTALLAWIALHPTRTAS